MGKTPTGSRPTAKVAKPRKSPNYSTADRSYNGVSGTKRPTGARPTPTVARDVGSPHGSKPPGNRRATRETPMPAPKRAWNTRGGGAPYGG
jgi:hypothetical protein